MSDQATHTLTERATGSVVHTTDQAYLPDLQSWTTDNTWAAWPVHMWL